ncbi:MAG TPA: tetratricopeptide repeat protein [Planctomycetota bacterium]|nr:tetratricopeptide repeat protein [Planctomycetota bacterium]
MSGQTIRWGLAFAATTALSASLLLSATHAPAPEAFEPVAKRDPASVGDVERELMLNKIREGDLLSQKKDLVGARRAWHEARRMGEGLWPIHEGLGDSYARARLFDDALREYRQAAQLVPEKLSSMRLGISAKRAAALASSGRPLDAIQGYLDLNQPEIFAGRLVPLVLDAAPVEGVKLVERHAEVYDARLFKLVSLLLSRLQRKPEAAEALSKFVIRVAPWDQDEVQLAVAWLREVKHSDTAVEVCRAWVRSVPQAAEGYRLMGDVLWDAGREREALIAYSSMVDVKPGDAGMHRLLGETYQRRNRPDEARTQFERGLKIAPQDEGLKQRLAGIYQAMLPKLRAEGKLVEVRALRQKLAELGVLEAAVFDVKVVMTWDVSSDVDMDILEPDGTLLNHANRASKVGGKYYLDNTQGLGPETYTLAKATSGRWRIGAHLHSGAKSTVKFVVILHQDTPQEERREETLILEKTGSDPTFIRDIVIP